MQKNIFFILLIAICGTIYCQQQESDKYLEINPVVCYRDSLQKLGDYEQSLSLYLNCSKDAKSNESFYQLAVNYAKLHKIDSAFYYLSQYVDVSFDDRLILVDKAFDILRTEKSKWEKLVDKIEKSYLVTLPDNVNKELALELFYLSNSFNLYKYYIDLLEIPDTCFEVKKSGDIMIYFLKEEIAYKMIRLQDIQNENRFKDILQHYGFPIVEKAGKFGETLSYLMLDKFIVSKNYIDSVETLYRQGNFDPIAYALIKDKYLVDIGKKQEFATYLHYIPVKKDKMQILEFTLYPVRNFKNVNARRKNLGLTENVEEYVEKRGGHIPEKYY